MALGLYVVQQLLAQRSSQWCHGGSLQQQQPLAYSLVLLWLRLRLHGASIILQKQWRAGASCEL